MTPEPESPSSERDQTDESLRVEREKADQALEDDLAAIDETADAVIIRARARADKVLALARARTDRQVRAPGAPVPRILMRERAVEDQVLERERGSADETLEQERAEKVDLLETERDETDRNLLSERKLADDAVATRDEFLGIVSHDLRNMLNAVVGYAAMIDRGSAISQPQDLQKYARRIQKAGARMDRLIGDLVDVASIEAGVLAVTQEAGDPGQAVIEAADHFQPQAAASNVSLTAEIVRPLRPVAFDSARIQQVLSNLLSNAIKFTPASGQVVLRVEQAGDETRFAVRDTGIGIPADKLEAVFVRFHQVTRNDRRGVGLGLYISKAIVQGHSGRIWAESTVGEGSTFSFTLPTHAPA